MSQQDEHYAIDASPTRAKSSSNGAREQGHHCWRHARMGRKKLRAIAEQGPRATCAKESSTAISRLHTECGRGTLKPSPRTKAGSQLRSLWLLQPFSHEAASCKPWAAQYSQAGTREAVRHVAIASAGCVRASLREVTRGPRCITAALAERCSATTASRAADAAPARCQLRCAAPRTSHS